LGLEGWTRPQKNTKEGPTHLDLKGQTLANDFFLTGK